MTMTHPEDKYSHSTYLRGIITFQIDSADIVKYHKY